MGHIASYKAIGLFELQCVGRSEVSIMSIIVDVNIVVHVNAPNS